MLWYVVVSSGIGNTEPANDEITAWERWERKAKREYGYEDDQMGTARAAHCPQLKIRESRKSARQADISQSY